MTVSVVITCHNYGRYLRECLESVLAQERPPEEILVVDDASTDDTPAIAAAYAPFGVRYERVEYQNACQSYNHGIAATTGELIAFVDADNALKPRFLGALAATLEADPALGFAYSDRYWAGEVSATAWADLGVVPGTVFRSFPPEPAMLVHANFIDTMSMVRRSAVEAVGGFKDMPILWDYQLWLAILEAGWGAHYLAEPLYDYRVHGSNMIVATRPQHRGCALLIRREHFTKPYWAPYLRPELVVHADIVPGQSLSGGTPCQLFLTPEVVGSAFPARLRISVTLPVGIEYLDCEVDRTSTRVTERGSTIVFDIAYPVPDLAASAVSSTLRLTLVSRAANVADAINVTITWQDIFETEHKVGRSIDLPTLVVTPPLRQTLEPGGIQTIRGQFAPHESVTVWAAMPDGAPRAAITLPWANADGEGVVHVDCRAAPRGFAAIVVQGELLRNLVVLVPDQAVPVALPPRPLTRGGQLGLRALTRLRHWRGIQPPP
ncbi:MAG TPA: glycosyltransferase family 2 protein [Thermomicrobiales bacterium]